MVHADKVCDPQQQTLYSIVSGNRAAEVRCMTWQDAPADRWLSVAETFEFLTAEE